MNNKLFTQIANHKSQLEQHPFCINLHNCNRVEWSFIPKMTFFVLGFRDMLEAIHIDKPTTDLERSVNLHCKEDSEHWQWFLQDLNTLGMDVDYWGGSMSSILGSLWSAETYKVRRLVYKVIHHIQSSYTIEEKLTIIECLEAAFAAFINNLSQLAIKSKLYEDLIYFGKHHRDEEAAHTMGSWVEDDKSSDNNPQTESIRDRYMLYVIDDIFAGFDEVFHCWNSSFEDQYPLTATM